MFYLSNSSIKEHLGCFYLLAIVSSDAVNVGVQIPLQDLTFDSSGYIPKSGKSIYNFLTNFSTYGKPLQT